MLVSLSALVAGALATLPPLGAALAVFLDPLRRRATADSGDGFLRVANIELVPPDGIPRAFPVVSNPSDAWNRYEAQPIGSVYLMRTAEDAPVTAVSTTCPHAGCYVDYRPDDKKYACPCHRSTFQPDGVRIEPERCPSPRDLDALEVAVREGAVWVRFQRFRSATPLKIVES